MRVWKNSHKHRFHVTNTYWPGLTKSFIFFLLTGKLTGKYSENFESLEVVDDSDSASDQVWTFLDTIIKQAGRSFLMYQVAETEAL